MRAGDMGRAQSRRDGSSLDKDVALRRAKRNVVSAVWSSFYYHTPTAMDHKLLEFVNAADKPARSHIIGEMGHAWV